MKLAWLCYWDDNDSYLDAKVVFKEPEPYEYYKIVPITFMEITE